MIGNLRRRLPKVQWQVWGFMVLGIAVGLASIYFHSQDVEQRGCFLTKFSDLSSNLGDRAEFAKRDAKATNLEGEATRLESKANNDFYKAAFASTDAAGFFDAYGSYRVKLAQVNRMRAKVDRRRAHIAEDREANPIPNFPAGTCD